MQKHFFLLPSRRRAVVRFIFCSAKIYRRLRRCFLELTLIYIKFVCLLKPFQTNIVTRLHILMSADVYIKEQSYMSIKGKVGKWSALRPHYLRQIPYVVETPGSNRSDGQCDQIGRFFALWATIQSIWQQ